MSRKDLCRQNMDEAINELNKAKELVPLQDYEQAENKLANALDDIAKALDYLEYMGLLDYITEALDYLEHKGPMGYITKALVNLDYFVQEIRKNHNITNNAASNDIDVTALEKPQTCIDKIQGAIDEINDAKNYLSHNNRHEAARELIDAIQYISKALTCINKLKVIRVDAGPDQDIILPDTVSLNGTVTVDCTVGTGLDIGWSKVSGPNDVVFADPKQPVTSVSFSEAGEYVLRLTASDSILSSSDDVNIHVDAIHRTYTTDADFNEGIKVNLSSLVPDQLQLDDTMQVQNYIWVAVSSKGTIVKINTDTCEIMGEYYTSPQGQPKNPSRTTVDLNGNIWATNRDGHSVVSIGLVENNQWIDKNGDGNCDTSTGLGDIKPWTNKDNADTNGGVSTAEDECTRYYIPVSSWGTRHVSVDKDNNVWVSGTGNRIYNLIDGKTGQILRTEGPVGYGGYGGLIDKNGVIWSANPLLRWDTSKPLTGPNGVNWKGYDHNSYGLGIDSKGNVWNTSYIDNCIRKFAPDGTLIGVYTHGDYYAQGCVVDKNDDVWVAHSLNRNTVGHIKNDGTFVGSVVVGNGPTGVAVDSNGKIWATNYYSRTVSRIDPNAGTIGADGVTQVGEVDFTSRDLGGNLYNYSDMTGSTLIGAPKQGTWTVIFDSKRSGLEWGSIGWNGTIFNDGLIKVSVSSSEDGSNFSALQDVSNNSTLNVPAGQYLKVITSLKRSSDGQNPILTDITVGAKGYKLPQEENHAPIVEAGQDANIIIGQQLELKGEVSDDCLPDGAPLNIEWSMESGPGQVTFDNSNGPTWVKASFDQIGEYVLKLTASDSSSTISDTMKVIVSAVNLPPVVDAGPDQNIKLPNSASLNGTVTDDGLPSGILDITWSKVSGLGIVTFANDKEPVTTASFSEAGEYVLSLTADDSALSSSDTMKVIVSAVNLPPVVDAGSDQNIELPNVASLNGIVTDDGLPSGILDITWSKVSGPGIVTFANDKEPVTTASFSEDGEYILSLTASDSVLSSSDTMKVIVSVVNLPPVVDAGPNQNIELPNSASLNGTVTDDGLPSGILDITWSKASGPGIVTFANNKELVTTASFSEAGEYVLSLTADDSALSSSDTMKVMVDPEPAQVDYERPIVQLSINPAQVNVGETVNITVNATDNIGVISKELKINEVTIELDSLGKATYTVSTTGIFKASASALDAAGNEGNASGEFAVLRTGDTVPPVVSFSSPDEDSKLYMPTTINGTATDDNLMNYKLEYSEKDKNEFIEFASGTLPVVDGSLGTFDPTQLINGFYDVRLTAIDTSGNKSSVIRTFQVEGQAKVGNFSIAFNDLTVPVSGMPITVVRSYDSRNKSKGDFGIGWAISLQNIRLSESCVPGEKWQQTKTGGGIPTYYLTETKSHVITVTYPDGKTDKFYMQLNPSSSSIVPIPETTVSFSALSGTFSTLEALTDNYCIVSSNQGPVELLDYNSLQTYNPNRYKLIQKDGTVLIINQTTGLESITDTNGNQITFSSNGIIHSAGKSVTFERDSYGRIIAINDLLGNKISYSYDYYGDLVAVTNQIGEITRFTYNSMHQVIDIISPTGIVPARNLYDDNGRLIAQIDSAGNRIEYTHNIGDRQEIVTDRLGNQTVMFYDDRGNVLSKTDPMAYTTTYTYDQQDNILSETDALNNTTTYTYDAYNNKTSETNALGYKIEYTYDSRGNVLTTKDPLGNIITNIYDAYGNLVSTKDPLGNETKYEYDQSGNKKKVTNALGYTQNYTYDQYGNMTSSMDYYGNVTNFTYDANGNKLTQTTTHTTTSGTESITTTNIYDGLNRIIETIDPYNYSSKIEYNSIGKKSTDVDVLGNKTEYQYDDFGNLVQTLYVDGTKETKTYDLEGNVLSSTDPEKRTTNFEYDKNKRLIKTTYADGSSSSIEYDKVGNQVKTIDGRGFTTTYAYDAANRNTNVTDSLGQITFYEYDGNNNKVKRTDSIGHMTSYQYDAKKQLIKTILNDNTEFSIQYDILGRKSQETDQEGNSTKYDYDSTGRLTKVTDALANETKYNYDEVGNQVSQIDANGHETKFEYDKLGNRKKRILPLGMVEIFEYDAKGRMTAHTDFNGNTAHYEYDVRDRKIKEISPSGQAETYTYTLNGQRKSVIDLRGTTAYEYDLRDRLIKQTNPDGTVISYSYDAASNRTGVTIPSGTTSYEYDELNRLTKVIDSEGGNTVYTYDAVGNRASEVSPNGIVMEYTYDTLNRLLKLVNKNSNGDIISSYEYTLGPSGNRLKVTEASGRMVDYSYDSTYKLIEEKITDTTAGNRTIDYSYDAVGNRLVKVDNGITTNYTYDENYRLLSEGSNTYTYDNNGNTISKISAEESVSYSYDYRNRLISATTNNSGGGSASVEYMYDVDDIRVQKKVDSQISSYLMDENRDYAQVLEERDGNGNLTVSYVYGDDLISQTRGNDMSYYIYDGNMSTRFLTDEAGNHTDTYTYDAFGVMIHMSGTTVNDYLYTGEQYDANVGFYYLRARYMNPNIGLFITVDEYEGSIFDPLTLHKYLYANANPVNMYDPSGQFSLLEALISFAIVTVILGITFEALKPEIYRQLYLFPARNDIEVARLKVFKNNYSFIQAFNRYSPITMKLAVWVELVLKRAVFLLVTRGRSIGSYTNKEEATRNAVNMAWKDIEEEVKAQEKQNRVVIYSGYNVKDLILPFSEIQLDDFMKFIKLANL
jgi:RHS repeat-associated protein